MSQSFSQGIKKLLGNRIFLAFLGGSFLVNQTMTAFGTYFVIAFQSVGGPPALRESLCSWRPLPMFHPCSSPPGLFAGSAWSGRCCLER